MDAEHDIVERMAKDYRLSNAERVVIIGALYDREKAYRSAARNPSRCASDRSRLHDLAGKTACLIARLEGTMIGHGYAFTEI